MVHTGIFAAKAEIDVWVGENVDATGYVEANINAACLQIESLINCVARENFSDSYAGLNADVKGLLSLAEATLVAIQFIQYNMAGYTSRVEAEDMINLCWAYGQMALDLLTDTKVITFINGA